jgi:hypothetical protein
MSRRHCSEHCEIVGMPCIWIDLGTKVPKLIRIFQDSCATVTLKLLDYMYMILPPVFADVHLVP